VSIVSVDWRQRPSREVKTLIDAEALRWRETLHWDVSLAWTPIEPARAAGHLPGFVALENGRRVAGWTCFVTQGGTLQIAMLVADTADATRSLLDAIAQSPEAVACDLHALSVRDAAPGLSTTLATDGFDVESYHYMSAPVRRFDVADAADHAWPDDEDPSPVARLCGRAYARSTLTRAFAPRGTWLEWRDYVAGLVAGPGCGFFQRDASFVVPGLRGEATAAVLTTELAPGVHHIAQIVVDPDARRHGLARALLQRAFNAAADAGATRITLLVAASNTAANALYESMGFEKTSRFVVGLNRQPRRSNSVALATGGASTRR
jgi:ribosomal protein S18 acetylase RimI-like enzyme